VCDRCNRNNDGAGADAGARDNDPGARPAESDAAAADAGARDNDPGARPAESDAAARPAESDAAADAGGNAAAARPLHGRIVPGGHRSCSCMCRAARDGH
jgi:hypothetical protein